MWDSAQPAKRKNKDFLVILVTSLQEERPRNRSSSPATPRAFSTLTACSPILGCAKLCCVDTRNFITGTKGTGI